MLKRRDAFLNNVRSLTAEHVYFFRSTTLWFSSKKCLQCKIMHGPDSCLFHFQVFTQSAPALSLDKSAALTFGWPWHPAGSTCFVCDSFILHASPSCLSPFWFFHPSSPLPLWSPAVKEIQNAFWAARTKVKMWLAKKKLRICFCTQIGQCSNCRKGLICLINPSRAPQEFRMIRSEFTRFVFCFYLSFNFFCTFFCSHFIFYPASLRFIN